MAEDEDSSAGPFSFQRQRKAPTSTNVSDAPTIRSEPGHVAYFVALSDAGSLVDTLNAGWKVDLYRGQDRLVEQVRVMSIVCGRATPPPCSIVVDVAELHVPRLLSDDKRSPLQVVARSAP